jgi:putative membrane protein
MRLTGLFALACVAGMTAACGASDVREPTPNVSSTDSIGTTGQAGGDTVSHGSDSDARHFAIQASKHGAAEVELGRLAAQKGRSREVKQFAEMMIADHTRGGDELKQAAEPHGVELSSELPDESEELMARLQRLEGVEFDRAYMAAMVNGHQEMRSMITGRLNDARRMTTSKSQLEAAVDGWAAQVLSTVEAHLAKAQQINDSVKNRTNDTQ